jgi:prepilin-type processing-associated H-X9-DG protein
MKQGATIPASFPDGTSNTFVVAEAAKPVIWTKPDDMEFDGKTVPALGGSFDGRFTVGYCDGSVRRFKKGMDADILKLLIDPADGNVIPELSKWEDHGEEK